VIPIPGERREEKEYQKKRMELRLLNLYLQIKRINQAPKRLLKKELSGPR
jgi:hypothetical protein